MGCIHCLGQSDRNEVGVSSARFQQAGIGHPRSQRKQPHQQHQEGGVAFGANVGEELHAGANYGQFMLTGQRNDELIFVKRR